MDANLRWGRGILFTRLLLFLGLLVGMILLAGLVFSQGDKAISDANAQDQYSTDGGQENVVGTDSRQANPVEVHEATGQTGSTTR